MICCLLFFLLVHNSYAGSLLDISQIKNQTLPSTQNKATVPSKKKMCSISIPDNIKKTVPKDMHYYVYLQMILNLIKSEYANDLSDCELTEKAIIGTLATLDPHSAFLNEKALSSLKNQTDGSFGGLGIEITMDDGFIRIISPLDDTPAYIGGLKSGDLIIYINDECINGIASEEVLDKLRGKPKSKVKLKIKRGDTPPFDVELERDIIKIQSVKAEILDNIGYIRISTFDKNTSADVKKFINDNANQGLHGFILDLRNNSGGLLDEAVSTADIFLKGGTIVSTKGRTKENTSTFFANNVDLTNGLPLVVLINSGTASAPEIVAGALRDNKRAIIVGVRSFGKGSVQKLIQLSEKSAIKITVAKHYTPKGECIQANGIAPDIEAECAVVKKAENVFVIREELFNNALDAENKEKNKTITDAQNKKVIDTLGKKKEDKQEEDIELSYRKLSLKERAEKDYQLNKAFDVVKALHFLSITKLRQDEKK